MTKALIICIALAACGGTPDPDEAAVRTPGGQDTAAAVPGTAGPATPVPAAADAGMITDPAEAAAEPAPGQAARWTAEETRVTNAAAGVATLRAVRVARQDGYDRIVLDFGADPLPGYLIGYIDRPVRQCGSGNTVQLAGDGWLQVRLEPASAHTDEGAPTITERSRAPSLPVIMELKLTCDFEAQVEWVAGVAAPQPYRVLELTGPTRLVIDLRH